MRIKEITSSAEYRMVKQFQKLPIFVAKFWFSKLKKNPKISQILQFRNFLIWWQIIIYVLSVRII